MPVNDRAIIVAGVSGCGKTTIGRALAEKLGWSFIEADDFHTQAARDKMAGGEPLDDTDRAPWLAALSAELSRRAPAVLACSALKQSYRERLSEGLYVRYVWIRLSRELARARVAGRKDHFMPADLVESQFEAAEVPEEAIFIDASEAIETSVQRCLQALGSDIAG